MMPHKDPLSYPATTYGLVILFSAWGGVVNWFGRVRAGKTKVINITELIGEISIAGFSGMITFLVCESKDVAPLMTAALVGIAGHVGSRTIFLLERRLLARYFPECDDLLKTELFKNERSDQ